LEPVGELVGDVPAPGGDHRENNPPTFLEQNLMDSGIERACLVRHVGNVEIDRPHTTRFEAAAEQTIGGREEVTRMRFSV